jgi:hypothetical protein
VARSAGELGDGWQGGKPASATRGCSGSAVRSTTGRKPPHIRARRSPAARLRMPRLARRPKPRPARVTVEEQATDRWAKGGRGCRRTRRLHAGVRTPRLPRCAQRLGKERPSAGARPGSRGVCVAGVAHDVVPRRGAALSGRSISQCPGSDVFNSKILN